MIYTARKGRKPAMPVVARMVRRLESDPVAAWLVGSAVSLYWMLASW